MKENNLLFSYVHIIICDISKAFDQVWHGASSKNFKSLEYTAAYSYGLKTIWKTDVKNPVDNQK